MKHELKTDTAAFSGVYNGVKNFEIRKNDRDYQVSDTLLLRETRYTGDEMREGRPLFYTGREVECVVNYILHGPIYGLMEGWVIMGIDLERHSSTPLENH